MSTALPNSSPREAALQAVPAGVVAACSQAIKRIHSTHGDVRSIGVTSTVRGEGVSTVAAGMAIAFVRSLGCRAILVDLDTDCWMTAAEGNLGRSPDAPAGLMNEIQWTNADLGILRLGSHLEASELTLARAGSVIADVQSRGYYVVSGLSCLPPTGSGDQFAGLFDVVVLVVRAGATQAGAVRASARAIPNPPVVMLNGTHSSIPRWFRFLGGR